ncbi:MAG: hypothetical protein ACOX1X_02615 [Dethiobacteria bacterium]
MKSYSIFLFFLLFLIGCNLSSAETNFSGSGEYWEANFIVKYIKDQQIFYLIEIMHNKEDTKNININSVSYQLDWLHKDAVAISDSTGNESLIFKGDSKVPTKIKISLGETTGPIMPSEAIVSKGQINNTTISEMSNKVNLLISWDNKTELIELQKM